MSFHGVEKAREGKEQGLDSRHKEQSGGVESEWRDGVKRVECVCSFFFFNLVWKK